MRKKKKKKQERKRLTKSDFSVVSFSAPAYYIREYFCELLGSIILSAWLVWGL